MVKYLESFAGMKECSNLDEDWNAVRWAVDGTVGSITIELFGTLVKQVFGSGGNDGLEVVVCVRVV